MPFEDAEDRRVGSDAESEGDHRDGGEHGRLPQAAKNVLEAHDSNTPGRGDR